MIDRVVADPAVLDETSEAYLGQWNQLVSTTNWEKGRIILEWRDALIVAAADPAEYSDEAWARRVGNVSGQHVGRLRRVFERFGAMRPSYGRLYWSHFQAALDWDDAEMWLEGALQSRWSIAEMRRQRWQALGAPADDEPLDDDTVAAEMDEDAADEIESQGMNGDAPAAPSVASSSARDAMVGDDDSDADFEDDTLDSVQEDAFATSDHEQARFEPVRPFADLPDLPDDLSDAFELYKLAILRHKLAGWTDISQDDVLASLDSLKQLALAPAE